MKNTILGLAVLILSAAAWASTEVAKGDELDYFSQLIDVFTIRAGETTVNSALIVAGIIAFCVVAGIGFVCLVVAGFIFKKKK